MKWCIFLIFLINTNPSSEDIVIKRNLPKTSNTTQSCCDGKNIVIGDSQTPYVDWGSEKFQLLGTTPGQSNLWEGGKTLSWLLSAVKTKNIDTSVCNVAICIGTNGGFNYKRDSISSLVKNLKLKFPKSTLYVIQGSWGWGGVSNETESGVRSYYLEFQKLGVKIVEPPIGKIEPHGRKPIYKVIGKNLDSLITCQTK